MPAFSYTSVAGRPHRPFVAHLKKWLPQAVALVRRPPATIGVSLVGDRKMAALHQQFMNLPGTTDVLTFELDHNARGRCTEGEIVVCVGYARREARRHKLDVRDELLLYALHGVLHLSGFDDLDPGAHRKMHREEDKILNAIGIGALFHR